MSDKNSEEFKLIKLFINQVERKVQSELFGRLIKATYDTSSWRADTIREWLREQSKKNWGTLDE